jgi:hypothetical protein
MYYLRCNHCGHANALKSEYVTFCESCSKKMANSYSDWKQRNPGRNFESYCEAVGISEAQLATAKPAKKRSRLSTRWILIIISGLVVAAALGLLADQVVKRVLQGKKVPESWLTSEWQSFSTPKGIAVISTPVGLKPFELPLPPEVMQYVDLLEPYRIDTTLGMQIAVHEFEYKPGVEISLEGAAAGSVGEMQQMPGVSDFDFEEVNMEVSGEQAIRQTGKYKQSLLANLLFRNLMIRKDQRLIQIIVVYRAGDETAEKVADRVISSVELRNI